MPGSYKSVVGPWGVAGSRSGTGVDDRPWTPSRTGLPLPHTPCLVPGKNPGAAETTAEGKKRDRVEPSFLRFFEEESPDDLELAELIKEDLWSNPLQYYTGEAGDEFDDMEEFEEIDVDEEEEDLEDDEEEEEAEGGEKPK